MTNSVRILEAWSRLEGALRAALPFCSVQPPTQPSELLAALRINHRIGPDQDARIQALRGIRNRVAHSPTEPSDEETARFQEEVQALVAFLADESPEAC